MKHRSAFYIAIILTLSCLSQCSAPPEEQIQETFQAYKKAILKKDGETAYKQIDKNTRDYYALMLDHAMNLPAEKTRELTFVNQIIVLMARHMIEQEQIRAMDGKAFFVYAVNQGWIDERQVQGMEIEIQKVDGDKATTHIKRGEVTAPMGFDFRREDAGWRIDLTSVLEIAEQQFQGMIQRSQMDSRELIYAILAELSGNQPTDSVWEPLNQ
ncbi:MAG: hypothetical protein CMF59_08260 [Leptospiraceae bacterium]|nr:hypothetical protein [Leptospiraceae bacterium]